MAKKKKNTSYLDKPNSVKRPRLVEYSSSSDEENVDVESSFSTSTQWFNQWENYGTEDPLQHIMATAGLNDLITPSSTNLHIPSQTPPQVSNNSREPLRMRTRRSPTPSYGATQFSDYPTAYPNPTRSEIISNISTPIIAPTPAASERISMHNDTSTEEQLRLIDLLCAQVNDNEHLVHQHQQQEEQESSRFALSEETAEQVCQAVDHITNTCVFLEPHHVPLYEAFQKHTDQIGHGSKSQQGNNPMWDYRLIDVDRKEFAKFGAVRARYKLLLQPPKNLQKDDNDPIPLYFKHMDHLRERIEAVLKDIKTNVAPHDW